MLSISYLLHKYIKETQDDDNTEPIQDSTKLILFEINCTTPEEVFIRESVRNLFDADNFKDFHSNLEYIMTSKSEYVYNILLPYLKHTTEDSRIHLVLNAIYISKYLDLNFNNLTLADLDVLNVLPIIENDNVDSLFSKSTTMADKFNTILLLQCLQYIPSYISSQSCTNQNTDFIYLLLNLRDKYILTYYDILLDFHHDNIAKDKQNTLDLLSDKFAELNTFAYILTQLE